MSVRHVLVALLSQGAKYGEQLRQEYEQTTGEIRPLNVGRVYATLQRLNRDGLTEPYASAKQRRARSFCITESSEQELSRWWGIGLAIDAELLRLDSVVRWLDALDHRAQQAVPEGRTPMRGQD